MRMLLLFLLLTCVCSPVLGASVFRQRYNTGMATLGGCSGGIYPNDNATYPLGACFAGNNASVWFNDCWQNGLGSVTTFNGSTTCNASFATSSSIFDTSRNGQQYCNVGTNPTTYNTYTCTDYTTPVVTATAPTQYITITNYSTTTSTNCSGNSTQFNITVGQCAPLGNGVYVIANCASGMVTGSLYSTIDCSVQYDMTGAINVTLSAFGPYSQMGAPSAAGKSIGAVGSDCANSSAAFMQFTCFPTSITLPTTPIPTPAPTTAAPTTAAPTGPTTAAPTGPTTAAPTGPTTAAPTGPTTAAPTGPTTAAPTGPTTAAPTGPTTAAPTGPTTAAPTGPTTAAPTGPTTAAPTGPTTAAPTGPTTAAPTGPTTAAPIGNGTGPTTGAPTTKAPTPSPSSTGRNNGAASHHAQATWLWAICMSALVGAIPTIY